MAVSYIGNHTMSSIKTAGTANINVVTTGSPVAAGNLLVAPILFDNAGTASKPVVSSIAKAAGETNNWVFLGAARSTSTSAGAFASGELWCIKTTVAWPAANYLVTLDTSVTMKATVALEFSGAEATLRNTVVPAYSTSTTAAIATTSGTAPVVGDLHLGFLFGSNVAAAQAGSNVTTGGAWSTPVGVGSTGGSGATNNFGIVQYKVSTATAHPLYNNQTTMTAGNGAIAAVLQASPEPAITQAAYRMYADSALATPTALAAQNTAYTADVTSADVNLGLRVRLQETAGGVVPATDDWQLQWEKNASGTWSDVQVGTTLAVTYPSSNASGTEFSLDSTIKQIGQSFIGNGQKLKKIGLYLQRIGSPNGVINGVVYSHSGTFGTTGLPNILQGTTPNTLCTDVATGLHWEYFNFDGTFTLENGTPYYVTARSTNTLDVPNTISCAVDSTSPTDAGTGARLAGTWALLSPTADVIFEVYTGPAVDPTTVLPYASSFFVEGAGLASDQLTGGTGTYVVGKASEDGLVDDLGWSASNYTEVHYTVTLKQADLANADTLRFRVLRNGATTGMTYTQVPTLNVTKSVGTDFLGTATFSGSGTLGTTRAPAVTGATATLSGGGVLSTVQVPRPAQAASLSGDGTLGAVGAIGALAFTGTATLTGDGTLATVQVPRPAQTAVLSGAGTLGTTRQVTTTGIATLSGSGTLATVQVPRPVVTAALSGDGALVAGGVADTGTVIATITSQLYLNGVPVGSPVSHTLSTNSANVYAEFTVPGLSLTELQSGTLTVRHVVTRANSTTSATVYVDSVELLADYQTVVPPGEAAFTGTATLSGDGSLSSTGKPGPTPTAALSGDGSLSTTGTPRPVVTAALSGDGSLTTVPKPAWAVVTTLSGSGTLSTVQVPRPAVTVALSGAGTLAGVGVPLAVGTATLAGAGTLAAVGVASAGATGVATLSGSGTLFTFQTPRPTQVATFSGSGTLAVTLLVPRLLPTVPLTGDGVLSTAAVVRVLGTAVLSGQGDLSAAGTAFAVTLDHMVTGIGWTDGTTYSTSVITGTTAATSVRLRVADDSGLTINVRYTSPVTPDANGYAKHTITTIAPGGTAYYKAETTPGGALETQLGRAKAAPTKGVATSLSLNFGSCQQTGFPGNTAIWSAITTHLTPDMWMHLGDNGYDDNPSTVQADHRVNLMAQMNGRPAMAAAAYQAPSLWQRSDHDSGPGDNNAGDYNTADMAARKQIYPYPPLATASDGIYFDTWWGKTHIVVIDTRTMDRSLRGAVDDTNKTRLGPTQKAWLLARLAEPCDFLVLVCESAWVGDGWSAGTAVSGTTTNNLSIDGWVRFTNEADQIAAAITSAGLTKKMLFIAGDSHVLAADSGKNNLHGGFPSAIAAPLDRASGGGNDGGPYTTGPYWRGTQGTVTQQFGNVSITPVGTAVYTGWDVNDLVTPKVSMRIAQDLAALSGSGTLAAVGLPKVGGPGGLSGSGTLTTTQAPRPAQTVTLSGSGSLSTTQVARPTVAPALSGTGTLSTTGQPKVTGAIATLSGTGTLSGLGISAGQAAFTGTGTLSTVGLPRVPVTAQLSGAGTLSTVQVPRPVVTAVLSGTGTLATTRVLGITRAVTLSGAGTLTAVGVAAAGATGVATLTGTGTLVAAGKPRVVTVAALSGDGVLSTVRVVRFARPAALSGSGLLSVVGKPAWSRAVTLSGSGTLLVSSRVPAITRTVALSGTGSLLAFGVMIIPGQQIDFVGVIPI